MLLIRFLGLILLVVAGAVIAVVSDVWWLQVVSLLVLIAATCAAVVVLQHYTGSAGWLGPGEEAQLERAGLVEPETGLPKRRRWNERRARAYADEVARRGLVAVPEGWRGPDGAYRVLLLTTTAVSPEQLRAALPPEAPRDDLAVLVVVPTLAEDERRFRLGDATEAVEHAETIARETVSQLRDAGIHVTGHIGPADPAVAVSDGLRTYDAQLVLAIRNPPGVGRYLEDVPLRQAAETFGVPLTEAPVRQTR